LYADIEKMQQSDAVLAIKKMSSPPVAADFNTLSFPDKDIAALRDCRTGSCDVKIDAAGLAKMQGVDWTAADATAKANEA